MEGVYAEGVPPYAAQGGGDCPGTDAGSGTESDDVLLRGAGNRTRKPTGESEQADFNEFWKQYYSLLDRQGYDLYAALSEWEKLTEEEKRLAVQNMVPYFESLTDIRFVKTACNYLRFKVYLRPENVEKCTRINKPTNCDNLKSFDV